MTSNLASTGFGESYREPLCSGPERGIRGMSPYCDPRFPLQHVAVSSNLPTNLTLPGDNRVSEVRLSQIPNAPQTQPSWTIPQKGILQQMAPDSAANFESDFTYYQLQSMNGDDSTIASDALKKYKQEKTVERTIIGLLSTL